MDKSVEEKVKTVLGIIVLLVAVSSILYLKYAPIGLTPVEKPDRTVIPVSSSNTPQAPTYHINRIQDGTYDIVVRLFVWITIPELYSKEEIEQISLAITYDISQQHDVNAISMLYFGPNTPTTRTPDIGSITWAPNGEWESAGDVQSGDYSSFKYTFFEPREALSTPSPTKQVSPTLEYQIANTDDVSFGQTRRLSVRIRVPKHYSKSEIENIARSVTSGITRRQQVNAIMMYFHGPNTPASGIPDIARVEWAPYGDWGRAIEVQSGSYSSFKYSVYYTPQTPAETLASEVVIELKASAERGLLGVPLPVGAELIERRQGNPAESIDPTERYQIEASAKQIITFYRNELPKLGWQISPPTTETAVFFEKGNLMIGVLTNKDGGTFTLMG